MAKNLNRHQMPVYLLPGQYKGLKNAKKLIRLEYNLSIPMTEMLRDSINIFLKKLENQESLELYLKGKGLIE